MSGSLGSFSANLNTQVSSRTPTADSVINSLHSPPPPSPFPVAPFVIVSTLDPFVHAEDAADDVAGLLLLLLLLSR